MADKHEYGIHPLATLMPDLSPEDRELLLKDIRAVGLIEPITLHEGKILDGRSRYSICKALGIELKDSNFVALRDGIDPVAFVFSKNIARRHLSVEQKRELVRTLVEKYPNLSSRAIAKLARVSDHTVEAVRTAQSAHLPSPEEKRVGADGKARAKPKSKRSVSAKDLKRQTNKFKSDWEGLNHYQKQTFVKDYQHELREILENVEAEEEAFERERAEA